jgi:HEPN superfamily Swt1-like protein
LSQDRDVLGSWLFRGLMFEAQAEALRRAGIRVGADDGSVETSLFAEALDPFPVELRDRALRMARLYAVLYCFENTVRDLIRERLQDRHGVDWWTKQVSQKIRASAESRKQKAEENPWLEGEPGDLLRFADFGDLAQIIIQNWDAFSDLIPTQLWLKQRTDELEQARNFVAHNRFLLPGEFQRMEMYVADWNRQVGV